MQKNVPGCSIIGYSCIEYDLGKGETNPTLLASGKGGVKDCAHMQVVTYEKPDSDGGGVAAAMDLNPVLAVVVVATKSIVNQLQCGRGERPDEREGICLKSK